MKLSERINVLAYLGAYLSKKSESLDAAIQLTYFHNRWFTHEHSEWAINTIATHFLQKELLENWAASYSIPDTVPSKKIAIILSGHIPLSGFHDILSVFITGHKSLIKLEERDKHLIPFFIKIMTEVDERVGDYFEIVERLRDFDAVIVNSGNKSSGYFENYFGKFPSIIRKNRNSVAILDGSESAEDLKALGRDIFQYFGLSSRSVSKIFVPEDYDFDTLLEALHEYKAIVLNDKFKNNFDYNYTLVILNSVPHKSNGCILLTEDTSLKSRIAQLHYEYYKNADDLHLKLESSKNEIECIVGQAVDKKVSVPFGKATFPSLFDYEDEKDTMKFLTQLN